MNHIINYHNIIQCSILNIWTNWREKSRPWEIWYQIKFLNFSSFCQKADFIYLEKNNRPWAVWQFFFIDKPARLIIRLLFGFAFDLTNSTNLQLLGGQCCLVFKPFPAWHPFAATTLPWVTENCGYQLVNIYNRIASKNLCVSLINFSHSWLQRLRSPLLRLIR